MSTPWTILNKKLFPWLEMILGTHNHNDRQHDSAEDGIGWPGANSAAREKREERPRLSRAREERPQFSKSCCNFPQGTT